MKSNGTISNKRNNFRDLALISVYMYYAIISFLGLR